MFAHPFMLLLVANRALAFCWYHVESSLTLARQHSIAAFLWCLAGIWALKWYIGRPKPVYLLDFSCYEPDPYLKCSYEMSEYLTQCQETNFTLPSLLFQRKIFLRSGLGDETYVPPFVFRDKMIPYFEDARLEAEMVMLGCVDELFNNTGVMPNQISVLVSSCSLFTPTPSHSTMLVNRYNLREDIKTIHLAGMGCSASVIACKLAKDLLKIRPNQYALVISTENVTLNWYFGNEKPRLVSSCLFRVGCASMLLTNKQSERSRSKYELLHCIRTDKGADDKAYGCTFQGEDEDGFVGVALNKDLLEVATDALRTNVVRLGPLILPFSDQLLFMFGVLCRKVLKLKIKQYQPDFKLGVQHFCFHAGGRAVINGLQKSLHIDDYLVEPVRATLHRFGNTSASTVWYILAYMEAKQRVKKGDKVWMLGLGAGFTCNSAIWRALDDIGMPTRSPWLECIHRYPVQPTE